MYSNLQSFLDYGHFHFNVSEAFSLLIKNLFLFHKQLIDIQIVFLP
jgi:hypothetical protein